VLGVCTGLFVTTAAEAQERAPVLEVVAGQILVTAVVAAALFLVGFRMQHPRPGGGENRRWLHWLHCAVWLVGIAAAVYALFGQGGIKVAALAIVPLVLIARRRSRDFASSSVGPEADAVALSLAHVLAPRLATEPQTVAEAVCGTIKVVVH